MKRWTVAPEAGLTCGACFVRVQHNQAVQEITLPLRGPNRIRYRCESCADGVPDQQEIDLEKARLEMELERAAIAAVEPSASRSVHRHRPMRSLKELAGSLPFDAKSAAAGRDE